MLSRPVIPSVRLCTRCLEAYRGFGFEPSARSFNPAAQNARKPAQRTAALPKTDSGGRSANLSTRPSERPRRGYIPLSFLVVPPILYWLYTSTRDDEPLSPYSYTDHTVSCVRKLTASHVQVAVPLDSDSRQLFSHPELVAAGPSQPPSPSTAAHPERSEAASRAITVHHVMVKNPDLMIERPYTPVNDVEADGEARLVVKRVRGGEVGRSVIPIPHYRSGLPVMIHGLQDGHKIGLRGPVPTFTLDPGAYDRVIMISSGTGAAPFLQFLSKLPAADPSQSSPKMHLIHASPKPDPTVASAGSDWITEASLLPALQAKHTTNLQVERIPYGTMPKDTIARAVARQGDERIIVLACLSPNLMRELCGNLTATLHQGEVTGLLREFGLSSSEVWKLE